MLDTAAKSQMDMGTGEPQQMDQTVSIHTTFGATPAAAVTSPSTPAQEPAKAPAAPGGADR